MIGWYDRSVCFELSFISLLAYVTLLISDVLDVGICDDCRDDCCC